MCLSLSQHLMGTVLGSPIFHRTPPFCKPKLVSYSIYSGMYRSNFQITSVFFHGFVKSSVHYETITCNHLYIYKILCMPLVVCVKISHHSNFLFQRQMTETLWRIKLWNSSVRLLKTLQPTTLVPI